MNRIPLDDRLPGLHEPDPLRSWRLTKAVIFALIAVAAVVWIVVDQRRASAQRALASSGASARARITALDTRRGGQHLTISYAFTVNGSPVEITGRKVGDMEGLALDGIVTVWYDPSDPRTCVTPNELTHARFGWTPWLYGGLIVVMMGLAGFQAWQVIQPKRDSETGE